MNNNNDTGTEHERNNKMITKTNILQWESTDQILFFYHWIINCGIGSGFLVSLIVVWTAGWAAEHREPANRVSSSEFSQLCAVINTEVGWLERPGSDYFAD